VVKLQQPKYAYYRGAVRPWEGAVIHAGDEGTYRGINVFEGLKGYWQPDGRMGILAVPRHYERLRRSARLLHVPFDMTLEQFEDGLHALVESLCVPDQEIWVRATLYLTRGLWGQDQQSDMIMTAFLMGIEAPKPVRLGVTAWRRATDLMLPARIKTSTNYQAARLARIEGSPRGFADMIMLNQQDRVAESGVACVLIVRDGKVSTPPPSEGALESITVDILEALARDMGIPFERRPIERTELYIADEIALAGTITELTTVLSVEDNPSSQKTDLLGQLARRYRAAARGTEPHPAIDLSCRRYGKPAAAAPA